MVFSLGCSGNQHDNTQSKAPDKEKTVKKKQKKKTAAPKKKKTGPTESNALEFFKAYGKKNPENIVQLSTKFGNIKLRLFDDTPIHRANFIYLIKNEFYENTEFYRVVDDFMIQGGKTDNQDVKNKQRKFGRYTLPAEFSEKHFHERGALAMSRGYDNNPDRRSSPFDFYIIQGGLLTEFQLNAIANSEQIKISKAKREVYKSKGGAPHLDNSHTVFGEVIEGMAVVDSIAKVRCDGGDWPINSVKINMKVLE